MDKQTISAVIARVIVSTKTHRRQFSLFDIAEDIKLLKIAFGSMQKVSAQIGITSGMLNKFLSIYKLPDEIIDIVKSRQIDRVSIVYHLSKFKEEDIIELAHLIVTNGLSSNDLKILAPYRKQFPKEPIKDLINKINDSKNIKVSVIRISKNDLKKNTHLIKDTIINLVGAENFLTVDSHDNYMDIKVTALGEKNLRELAKKRNQSFQELIAQLIK